VFRFVAADGSQKTRASLRIRQAQQCGCPSVSGQLSLQSAWPPRG